MDAILKIEYRLLILGNGRIVAGGPKPRAPAHAPQCYPYPKGAHVSLLARGRLCGTPGNAFRIPAPFPRVPRRRVPPRRDPPSRRLLGKDRVGLRPPDVSR